MLCLMQPLALFVTRTHWWLTFQVSTKYLCLPICFPAGWPSVCAGVWCRSSPDVDTSWTSWDSCQTISPACFILLTKYILQTAEMHFKVQNGNTCRKNKKNTFYSIVCSQWKTIIFLFIFWLSNWQESLYHLFSAVHLIIVTCNLQV